MPALRHLALPTLMLLLAFASPAFAHTGEGVSGGFLSGVEHPLLGPDHLVAMVAVGLWGAILGAPLIWALPITFPLVMAIGGLLGVTGVPLPGVEIGIALSAVGLGLAVALALRPPMSVAIIVVGVFAIFHGHAHGAELPEAANPISYGLGFVLATGFLHLCGIGIGLLIKASPRFGLSIVRACGGAVAAAGCWFLLGSIGGA